MTEKATTPEEPTPTALVKGIAHWSLTPEDNANVDAKINWAEGMLPSAVNNSARMMMTRIREQHDIDQGGGGFGNIKDITADQYTVVSTNITGFWIINFIFNDKLTEAQYANYKAGKLQLLVNLVAPKIIDDINYKRLSHNSIISINLVFKIYKNTYTHAMQFKRSFFGIEETNTEIIYHGLKYFVNNTTLQVGGNNITTNYYALPMETTYPTDIVVRLKNSDGTQNNELYLRRQWYYISPMELIFIDTFQNTELLKASIDVQASLPVGRERCVPLSITSTGREGQFLVGDISPSTPVIKYHVVVPSGASVGVNAWVVLYLHGPANTFTEYPIRLAPTQVNYYPLPV